MRTCCSCGASFNPTGKGYRCPTCRTDYDRAWRSKRKAEGKPISGTRMPPEYHRAYEKKYVARPDVRERRNAQMRSYTKSPELRVHHKARWLVHRALENGTLSRRPCEVCGASPAEAHHDDYTKPLAVRWLCHRHHVEHHAKAEGRS